MPRRCRATFDADGGGGDLVLHEELGVARVTRANTTS